MSSITQISNSSKPSGITSVKLGHRKHVLAQIAELKQRTVHSLVVEAVDAYIAQMQAKMEYELKPYVLLKISTNRLACNA
jgi:hypothetical protein